ncbi:MAG: rhodanese-like domain-containing protein [Bdellovibrionota bacterium]
MSYNKIGYYQLNNLIENRVPFLFFNFGPDVGPWYKSIQKLHVEAWQVMLDESQIQAELDSRKIPKDFAVLLLCPDGKQSVRIAEDLEKKGYTNVYLIDGGYQQMVTDRG